MLKIPRKVGTFPRAAIKENVNRVLRILEKSVSRTPIRLEPRILAYLNEQRAIDLVVMATAGRGGVARLIMGSVADKIVRAAPCPVLTIHPQDDAETSSTYRAA